MDKLVGIFCQYTPRELFEAAGMRTVTLGSVSSRNIALAETRLPKNLCPLVKASLGDCMAGTDPVYRNADLIVGETGCDGKKKMFEILGDMVPFYLIQVPQGTDRAYSFPMWKKEVCMLKEYIEKTFGVTITDEALREAVRRRNALRQAKMRLMDVQVNKPAASAADVIFDALMEAEYSPDIEESTCRLNTLAEELETEYQAGSRPVSKAAPRVLVTGCPIGGVYAKTVRAVEENGGSVVCLDSCHGIRAASVWIDPQAPDILEAIASAYIQIGCAIMDPAVCRADQLRRYIRKYDAAGVLDITLQTCHCYTVDTYFMRRLAEEMGVRYLTVDTDYQPSDMGQLNTRIGAFVETL